MVLDFPPLHGPMNKISGLEKISGSRKKVFSYFKTSPNNFMPTEFLKLVIHVMTNAFGVQLLITRNLCLHRMLQMWWTYLQSDGCWGRGTCRGFPGAWWHCRRDSWESWECCQSSSPARILFPRTLHQVSESGWCVHVIADSLGSLLPKSTELLG